LNKSGLLLLVVGPSGCGKTTVIRAGLEQLPEAHFSVSCTTRPPRAGEVDGVDYFFLGEANFEQRVKGGDFLEHAVVHGNRYGTLREQVTVAVAEGAVVILDIDVQGARQVRAAGDDAVFMFVLPPSMQALENRLRGRASDSEEAIARRLAIARAEMSEAPLFDYLLVNDELSTVVSDFLAVIAAERLRRSRGGIVRTLQLSGGGGPTTE
jgi:guanylate kinase